MKIGKTSSTVSKQDILSSRSEFDILSSYLSIKKLPCCINSPFREDANPSFYIGEDANGHIHYYDFATTEHGSLMDLLCKYWKCSFSQAVSNLALNFTPSTVLNSNKIKKSKSYKSNVIDVQVKIRKWEEYDYEYWKSYGVTPIWLQYAEVYPISHKIVIKEVADQHIEKIAFKTDKYAYVFVERKEKGLQLKIYQPFNKKGYKWYSSMDKSVISLWSKIPQQGEKLIICSSLKDALCVSCQLHIPTIALQGEGYSISSTALKELKKRYSNIFISFDTDKAGIENGKKLSEKTGFTQIIPNLGKEKDFSDYYKSLQDKTEFQKLKSLF